MTSPPRAVLGVQGAQSASNAGRGLARYVLEHAAALAASAPERLARIDLDPEAPLLARADLPREVAIATADSPPAPVPAIYHVMSPFEEIALDRVWPPWARTPRTALVATLYDLIPLSRPDAYLDPFPLLARRYRARLPLLAAADGLLCISQSTAEEAHARLAVPRERLFVIKAGAAARFTPEPDAGPDLSPELRSTVPALRPGFVLYVGGTDPRKNLDRLLEGYARLPTGLRRAHQLVLAQLIAPADRRRLEGHASRLGIHPDVVFTGFVTDALLVELYRRCALFVFPSLLEGFGLPALEAMRCGAPVIVGDIPTMRELVPTPEGRFDPLDASTIAESIRRGLTDDGLRSRLVDVARRQTGAFTWKRVAASTLSAYEAIVEARARRLSRR